MASSFLRVSTLLILQWFWCCLLFFRLVLWFSFLFFCVRFSSIRGTFLYSPLLFCFCFISFSLEIPITLLPRNRSRTPQPASLTASQHSSTSRFVISTGVVTPRCCCTGFPIPPPAFQEKAIVASQLRLSVRDSQTSNLPGSLVYRPHKPVRWQKALFLAKFFIQYPLRPCRPTFYFVPFHNTVLPPGTPILNSNTPFTFPKGRPNKGFLNPVVCTSIHLSSQRCPAFFRNSTFTRSAFFLSIPFFPLHLGFPVPVHPPPFFFLFCLHSRLTFATPSPPPFSRIQPFLLMERSRPAPAWDGLAAARFSSGSACPWFSFGVRTEHPRPPRPLNFQSYKPPLFLDFSSCNQVPPPPRSPSFLSLTLLGLYFTCPPPFLFSPHLFAQLLLSVSILFVLFLKYFFPSRRTPLRE